MYKSEGARSGYNEVSYEREIFVKTGKSQVVYRIREEHPHGQTQLLYLIKYTHIHVFQWKGTVFSETLRSCVRNMLLSAFIGILFRCLPDFIRRSFEGFDYLWGLVLTSKSDNS